MLRCIQRETEKMMQDERVMKEDYEQFKYEKLQIERKIEALTIANKDLNTELEQFVRTDDEIRDTLKRRELEARHKWERSRSPRIIARDNKSFNIEPREKSGAGYVSRSPTRRAEDYPEIHKGRSSKSPVDGWQNTSIPQVYQRKTFSKELAALRSPDMKFSRHSRYS